MLQRVIIRIFLLTLPMVGLCLPAFAEEAAPEESTEAAAQEAPASVEEVPAATSELATPSVEAAPETMQAPAEVPAPVVEAQPAPSPEVVAPAEVPKGEGTVQVAPEVTPPVSEQPQVSPQPQPVPQQAELPPPAPIAEPPPVDLAPAQPTGPLISEPETDEDKEVIATREALFQKIRTKLIRADKKLPKIVVAEPIDFTNREINEAAGPVMVEWVKKFGDFRIKEISYNLQNLTLEELRRVIARYDADLFILSAFKPTDFSIYLYDRRSPYQIYAYTETIAEGALPLISNVKIKKWGKLLVRKIFFEYGEGRNYELPRDSSPPVLASEMPRRIASADMLNIVNRELVSRHYIGANVGVAVINSPKGSFETNIIALQYGFRPFSRIYFETAFEVFTYNSWLNSIRYLITSPDTPIKFLVGLGAAATVDRMVITNDATKSFSGQNLFIVPSASLMAPLVDAHFKLETKLYYSIFKSGFIFSVMPGVIVNF